MTFVDRDNNGEIDFFEFMLAVLDKDQFINKNSLHLAFQMIDKDNIGMIKISEMKNFFQIS